MREISLYFHIPYCKSKCFYCDFNSYVNKKETVEEYFEALINEIDLYKDIHGSTIKTIFFGGGSPSLVESKYIRKVIDKCREVFVLEENCETTIESNPENLTKEKLVDYINIGINRLSIGLQAWQDNLLKNIGRIHNQEQFTNAFLDARRVGFKNINVDLIFALPDQNINDWNETLNNVIKLDPEHLSCYGLKIEEGTKFYKDYEDGIINIPDEDIDREMYHNAKNILSENGYEQYEISNFAKRNYECRHNLVYWNFEEYIAFGAGAHSFFNNTRTENVKSIEEYVNLIKKKQLPYKEQNILSIEEQISEFIITRLRLINGLNKKDFYEKFNIKIEERYKEIIDKYVELDLLFEDESIIKLTQKGLDFSNIVMCEFV